MKVQQSWRLGTFRFTPDGNVVFLQGDFRYQNFWLADLRTGEKRQLTKLKTGYHTAFSISQPTVRRSSSTECRRIRTSF